MSCQPVTEGGWRERGGGSTGSPWIRDFGVGTRANARSTGVTRMTSTSGHELRHHLTAYGTATRVKCVGITLNIFKRIRDVPSSTSIAECFSAWWGSIVMNYASPDRLTRLDLENLVRADRYYWRAATQASRNVENQFYNEDSLGYTFVH